jgi:hypothetical protein
VTLIGNLVHRKHVLRHRIYILLMRKNSERNISIFRNFLPSEINFHYGLYYHLLFFDDTHTCDGTMSLNNVHNKQWLVSCLHKRINDAILISTFHTSYVLEQMRIERQKQMFSCFGGTTAAIIHRKYSFETPAVHSSHSPQSKHFAFKLFHF